MSYQNLLLEQPEPGIYLLTVNRPQALNALNAATLDELAQAVAQVSADAAARVLLVTGAGDKAFVAGADISEMQSLTADQAQAFSEKGMQVMHALEALPVPVIALVQGYALGGATVNWPWPATGSSPLNARYSASPRSISASRRDSAARSGWRGWSAAHAHWNWSPRHARSRRKKRWPSDW